jgi:hypothetical protein
MAFNGNFMCSSFKKELLEAKHNFLASGGNTFRLALYTNSATFTAATTAYTNTNEIDNTAGSAYVDKGVALTNVNPSTSGTTALTDFADAAWTSASFTARGALLFNDTASGDPTVVVLDFGADKTASNGTFTVVFPAADASNAIIRIA